MLRPVSFLRRRWLAAGASLAVIGGGFALAQTVDGIDVDKIMGRASESNPDAEALAREVAARGEALRNEAQAAAAGGQSNLERNAGKLGGTGAGKIDFDEIMRTATEQSQDRGKSPQLIVFASLSMPEDSLKRLISDTARAGGMVVFNGFPGNSMKAFQQGIMKVVDNNSDYASIGVDPRLFRAFEVKSVPTVVIITTDFDPCDGFQCTTQLPPFDRISGNVTLEYALETFVDGRGPGAAIAAQARARLVSGGGV